ncbi:uncharacterized protein [Arachis hypogaea]|uniref:uncharacterized protein n=1 Tax=Arachis hypogaea TaxID=3818 RepID=UPI003B228193
MADPFTLSTADQPGLILVTQQQLTEENYHSWHRAMKKALNAKRKLRFISGTIPRPDPAADPDQFENWIKMLWKEFSSYRPVLCNCGDACSMHDFLQSEYVHFLMDLDESFAQIRAQILLMESLPSINKVLSLVVQEERHRSIGASSSSNQVAFLAKNNQPQQLLLGRGRGQQKKNRSMCSYCGLLGHTVKKCYKIHGFPPGYGRGHGTKPSIHHVAASEAQFTLNLDQNQI